MSGTKPAKGVPVVHNEGDWICSDKRLAQRLHSSFRYGRTPLSMCILVHALVYVRVYICSYALHDACMYFAVVEISTLLGGPAAISVAKVRLYILS